MYGITRAILRLNRVTIWRPDLPIPLKTCPAANLAKREVGSSIWRKRRTRPSKLDGNNSTASRRKMQRVILKTVEHLILLFPSFHKRNKILVSTKIWNHPMLPVSVARSHLTLVSEQNITVYKHPHFRYVTGTEI